MLISSIQSSHFFAIVTVALLSLFLVYPLLLSSLSDLGSFAVVSFTKLVLLLLLLHSNCVPQLGILLLCVLCLAICLCSSPNLVGMLSLTGSLLFGLLLVVEVDIQLVYLFSVCYFVFGFVIAVVGIAMNSVFWFRNIFSRYRFAGE